MRISVIIPTLNESGCIERTLSAIADQSPDELIVVDAGSTDDTTEIASKQVDFVVDSSVGRSIQLNRGAEIATGDILVFLHADTILPQGGLELIRSTVMSGTPSGTFRLTFDKRHPLLSFSSFCTRFRSLNICFGDRCIFTDRATFDASGGFPPIPLFEDVEFVKQIAKLNKFAFLKQSVVTSSRRYNSAGVWRQQWKNTRLWLKYRLGVDPKILAKHYRYDN